MAVKRDKKISERGEPLPVIERSTGGGGGATAAEVAAPFLDDALVPLE